MSKSPIPSAALALHVIALGKTRSGKSSKLRLIVESLLDDEKPVCIIDPKGDWWGLKSSADGKHAGYPVVIFGGEHADVPINEHAGAHVAELVATGNRPCLIDLGGWMVGERTRFFIAFASTFFKLAKGTRFIIIDEVHNFAPQGRVLDPDAGKMLHWANRLASEGGGKGITLIAASQRPQKVHKDFVTSCETLIATRVIHKLDRDAIKDWIDGCADPAKGKEVLLELANMKRNEAWVWSPEVDFGPARIPFPMFKTYDSFKPQAADAAKLTGWAAVDLDDVRAKLTVVVKEAEANDPKTLRRRIAELERELRAKPVKAGMSPDQVEGIRALALAQATKHANDAARREAEHQRRALRSSILGAIDEVLKQPPAQQGVPPARVAPVEEQPRPSPGPPFRHVRPARSSSGNGLDAISPVQQRILDALSELEQIGAARPDRELAAFMAGYSNVNSTGFAKAIGSLSVRGLIAYPQAGSIVLTEEGRSISHPPDRPRTAEELQERVIKMIGGAGGRVLKPLIEVYPKSLARQELAEASGYGNINSTGFAKAIGRLRTLGFIDYPDRGTVVAKPVLFLE